MKLDKIIVVDIESTCWEEPAEDNISEIIEIGITPIDTKSKNVLETKNILVKPTNSKISEFCTKLTTLTDNDVNSGVSFKDACDMLVNTFDSKRRVWASYGNYDKRQFEDQCERENIEYPFFRSHINIKTLFAITHSLKKEVGMIKALNILQMPLVGTHHRGGDDSRNIANILLKILFK